MIFVMQEPIWYYSLIFQQLLLFAIIHIKCKASTISIDIVKNTHINDK